MSNSFTTTLGNHAVGVDPVASHSDVWGPVFSHSIRESIFYLSLIQYCRWPWHVPWMWICGHALQCPNLGSLLKTLLKYVWHSKLSMLQIVCCRLRLSRDSPWSFLPSFSLWSPVCSQTINNCWARYIHPQVVMGYSQTMAASSMYSDFAELDILKVGNWW